MASTFVRRLEGKATLITGAATGIGESTARLFTKHGAKVLVADVDDDLGEKVCKELGQSSASYVHFDVTKESDVETAINTAVDKFGKLDILHNNAGIGGLATFMRRLEGKVELMTSAASGISESTTRLFSIQVLIADIQDDLGEEVFKDLGQSSASFVHFDVTKEADVETAVNIAVAKYGKLDMMYNNAGIGEIEKQSILDKEKSEFKKIISVNLIGAFLGAKHAAWLMIPNFYGRINTTVQVCFTIGAGASHAYTSSKHGVVGRLTRNFAVELGEYNIHVNCVSPHLVATPLSKDFFKLNNE